MAKDFLYYKYKHHEIAGIHKTSMKRLFSGYKDVPESEEYVLVAANYGAVADINNDIINNIEKLDFNIAYIGRDKQYCDNIVKGIYRFADKHSDYSIHFIILGEIQNLGLLEKLNNIRITRLGFMHPIPRSLFKKLDTIIAGAGCASLSAREGVPTILADASECLSAGILGYTTKDSLFNATNLKSFDEELENVFFNGTLNGREYSYSLASKVDEEMVKHFEYINKIDLSKGFYKFNYRNIWYKKILYPCVILRDYFHWHKYK